MPSVTVNANAVVVVADPGGATWFANDVIDE
jgi:hypothetical protein